MFSIRRKFSIPLDFQSLYLGHINKFFSRYNRLDDNKNRKLSSISCTRGRIVILEQSYNEIEQQQERIICEVNKISDFTLENSKVTIDKKAEMTQIKKIINSTVVRYQNRDYRVNLKF
jgi:hypothetical protein